MQRANIPAKLNIPFANSAGGSFVTNPIPEASQIGIADGRASLTTGFPPLCFLPTGAGGVPPYGSDINGILFETTSWDRWFSAGGPVLWDSAFSVAIGGYPQGAVVQSTATVGLLWMSVVDDNTTNPDSGGANWRSFSFFGGPNGQAYLTFVNSSQVRLSPQGGAAVVLNGVSRALPAAGITLSIGNCRINGVAAQGVAASTVYNVYLFDVSGTLELALWTGVDSGHIADTTAGNVGVEVRNVSGTPDSTYSLVGKLATNSGGAIVSQGSSVISWFNRRDVVVAGLAVAPPQVSGASGLVELSASARIDFLSWGQDASHLSTYATNCNSNATGGSVNLVNGIDAGSVGYADSDYSAVAGQTFNLDAQFDLIAGEGLHFNTPMGSASPAPSLASYGLVQAYATIKG